jgi:hypothetical protein
VFADLLRRASAVGCVSSTSFQDVISGFLCCVNEICALLGYLAAWSGNSLPTFQDNLISWSLKMMSIGCPETSNIYLSTLCDIQDERRFRHICLSARYQRGSLGQNFIHTATSIKLSRNF